MRSRSKTTGHVSVSWSGSSSTPGQGDFYVGRSQYDSPEVDQEILIPAAGRRLIRGCFYQVRITAAEDYDLYGELETK